jgi:hypothetical protein
MWGLRLSVWSPVGFQSRAKRKGKVVPMLGGRSRLSLGCFSPPLNLGRGIGIMSLISPYLSQFNSTSPGCSER